MDYIPDEHSQYVRSTVLDLVLTILFCGLWNGVVQYYQIRTLNFLYREERYSFWKFSIYSLLTCGVYYIYHEYRKAEDLSKFLGEKESSDPILALVLAIFGFGWVYDAMMQNKLNDFLNRPQINGVSPGFIPPQI